MEYYHEKFPIVKDMITILYDYCCSGGCCHIVTDDDNIYDSDLDFVIEYAQWNENKNRIDAELSVAICKILKDMSFLQRAVLFDSINYEIDYKNKEKFDAFYDHDKESLERVFESYDWDSREKITIKENDILKKKILALLAVGILAVSTLTGCQGATKSFGGSMTLNLEPNQKLEEITWKDDSLWYLTRPMTDDDIAETHTFQQQSEFGVFEGTVIIRESKK